MNRPMGRMSIGKAGLLLLAGFAATWAAVAETVNWTPATPGAYNWGDANWNPRVPGSDGNVGDVATFPANASNQVINYNAAGPAFDQIAMTAARDTVLTFAAAMTNKFGITANDWTVHGNRLVFGSNARVAVGDAQGLNVSFTPVFVESGAVVNIGSGDLGGYTWNRTASLYHGTLTNRGSFNVGCISSSYGGDEFRRNNTFYMGGIGVRAMVDGGRLAVNRFAVDGQPDAEVVVTNGGSLLCYFGLNLPAMHVYGTHNTGYDVNLRVDGGTVTNHYGRLYLADLNGAGVTRPGRATITIANGLFRQDGVAIIGAARVGTVSVRGGGQFQCGSDVYLGGGVSNIFQAMPAAGLATGILEVAGGTVTITNAPGPGSAWVYSTMNHFYQASGPEIYSGARIVITNAHADLLPYFELGKTYYACWVKMDDQFELNPKLAIDGGVTTGGANGSKYIYYKTFPSQLRIGNWTEFSDGLLLIPGVLRLSSGTLTVAEVVATNGASSIVEFGGGTLNAAQLTVDTDAALTVGDGASEAVLNLTSDNLSSFADGLVLNTNATLSLGGTGAVQTASISGDLTLRRGSRLAWTVNATTQDCLTVSGAVTLPASLTVDLCALDGAARTKFPLIAATGGFTGSVSGWPTVSLGGNVLVARLEENTLVLGPPQGAIIIVR
ncbi:MAG: hypothetical protein PHR35_10570 [Kiritimatiellae bacterium]|nr:hypothetical protein [Kiritimatiellia bacterium]